MIKAVIFDMYETLITLYESPVYFGTQMAIDAGIEEEKFQAIWRPAEKGRSIGEYSFEGLLETILKKYNCYSEEKMREIVGKRIKCKEEAFNHLHKEIIPMLTALKEKGILIGLISNCFSEEAMVIKKSELYPFFDVACLSYDEGVQKPDPEIFKRCIDRLNVKVDKCLYVGDGGSNELEAAREFGMNAIQAVWYLKENTMQPAKRKTDFEHLESPMEIIEKIK